MPVPAKRPRVRRALQSLQVKEVRNRETRARALEAALARWLQRFARMELRRTQDTIERSGIQAAVSFAKEITTGEALEDELRQLLMRFGLQQIEDTGSRWAASLGGQWRLRPESQRLYTREVENKVRLIFSDTEQMVRDSIQSIVVSAFDSDVRPTAQDIGRQIAEKWTGDPDNPSAVFGPARARNIARTELGDADTAGALEGMAAAEVERVAWGARPDDNRSKRRHYLMNQHKALPVEGLRSGDRAQWFVLPSKAKGRRPMDPALPVGERVNCRCFLYPVR